MRTSCARRAVSTAWAAVALALASAGPALAAPPQCTTPPPQTVIEGLQLTLSGLQYCSDSDVGDVLTVAVGPASHGATGAVGDLFGYIPEPGYTGPDAFTLTASDGTESSDPVTVTISVAPNQPPSCPATRSFHVAPDTPAPFDPREGCLDDTGILNPEIVVAPVHGTIGQPGPFPGYVYTPETGYQGPDTFTVALKDHLGASDQVVVEVTISPNHAPTCATPVTRQVAVGGQLTLDLRNTCSDPDGDPMTAEAIALILTGRSGPAFRRPLFLRPGSRLHRHGSHRLRARDSLGAASNEAVIDLVIGDPPVQQQGQTPTQAGSQSQPSDQTPPSFDLARAGTRNRGDTAQRPEAAPRLRRGRHDGDDRAVAGQARRTALWCAAGHREGHEDARGGRQCGRRPADPSREAASGLCQAPEDRRPRDRPRQRGQHGRRHTGDGTVAVDCGLLRPFSPPRVRCLAACGYGSLASPTGALHIGNARTALYNWLLARGRGASLCCGSRTPTASGPRRRTSRPSSTRCTGSGIDWDEGPIYQSENAARHAEVVQQLIDGGHAYRSTAGPDEVRAFKEQHGSRGFRGEEEGAGAWRLRVPDEGVTEVNDVIRGRTEFENSLLDDLVIARADGTPVYHLAVVVDDADAGITHVVRGADHYSNTPKHVLIQHAIGAPTPTYAHLPLLHGPDGKKLSKRHGAASVRRACARPATCRRPS